MVVFAGSSYCIQASSMIFGGGDTFQSHLTKTIETTVSSGCCIRVPCNSASERMRPQMTCLSLSLLESTGTALLEWRHTIIQETVGGQRSTASVRARCIMTEELQLLEIPFQDPPPPQHKPTQTSKATHIKHCIKKMSHL